MDQQESPLLGQINLVVADMQSSVKFYRMLGLNVNTSHPFSEHHVSILMSNGFLLELDSTEFAKKWNKGASQQAGPSRCVIGFNLPSRASVDELFGRLIDAGYTAQQEPFDAFWGARYGIVEDPDRNPIGLMSPVDPQRQGAP